MLQRVRTIGLPAIMGCALLVGCSQPATRVPEQSARVAEVRAEDVQALAGLYAERLRLGFGSPFRLIEIAASDQRLGAARTSIAQQLLAQAQRGRMYEIDARAFMAAGMPAANAHAHLNLVQQTIEGGRDPRVAELALNLAYAVAAAEGAVTRDIAARATRVAALLRDRELALRDAARVSEAAQAAGVRPDALVPQWRQERRFSVEVPTLVPLSEPAQQEATRLSSLLIGGVRAAAAPVAPSMVKPLAAAARLPAPIAEAARLPAERQAQGAVVITLRAIRSGITDPLTRVAAPHWQQFFDRALDEETVVAEATLARRNTADDVVAAGILLDIASALRPYGQERIGTNAATVADLRARFGVRIRFGSKVSAREQARSLDMLAYALEDMRAIMRSMDLAGLTFHIAPIDPEAGHLAFHDPARRVIRLDPATMSGTLAHEIGHDLDWQLARRKYRTRKTYATDFATRTSRNLAYTVENLIAVAAPMDPPNASERIANRPAEVFARRFEWYVASALALEGRSNGDLSSVQSDWNPGYGSARRPDATAGSAKAFASLLAEATRMDRTQRAAVERVVVESAPRALRMAYQRQPLEAILGICGGSALAVLPGTRLAESPFDDGCDRGGSGRSGTDRSP